MGLILCGLLVCLVFGRLGVQAARPFLQAARLRADNDRMMQEMLRARLENQRAEKEIKALDTREGIQRAARKLGWILPNERKLRIPAK